MIGSVEHRHNNLIEGSTNRSKEQRENFHADSIRQLLSFRAVNSICSRNNFLCGYVCSSWVCLDAGECFFFFKTSSPLVLAIRSVKEFAYFLSEMWSLFFRINSRLAATSIEVIDPRVKFGKQECGSLRHITLNDNKLVTHIKIHRLNLTC